MRQDPTLNTASRLARSGKYEAALRLLQPQITRYGRSFRYYRLLGTVCLYAGDFGGALTYLRLAREINGRDPSAILGLAALYVRRNDINGAIDLYLEVLELDGKNAVANRAMKVIRKQAGTDAFSAWLEAGRLPSLYPPIPFPGFSKKQVGGGLGVLFAICAVCFGVMVHLGVFPNPLTAIRLGPREIPDTLLLTRQVRMAPVRDGEYLQVVSRDEAVGLYERAMVLFSHYRDNAARVYLNRILESNAAAGFRDRANLMLHYMNSPAGFHDFRAEDNVSLTQVRQNPPLYRGVYVVWRGHASNVDGTAWTSFDLVVGDDRRRITEGIVNVVFDDAVFPPEGPIEVLGRVVPLGNGGFRLDGINLNINPAPLR